MYVSGGRARQRTLVISMIDYCVATLVPKLINKLEIDVWLKRNLLKEEGGVGFCMALDNKKYTREFEIALHSALNIKSLLVTVAHEMVHVKQLALAERVDKGGRTYWRGAEITDTSYDDSPWEVEAYGLEYELFEGWLTEHHSMLTDKEVQEILDTKDDL